ncbi:MAG: hypothetical protein ACFE96_11280 [Candidatus Hermodarchaeota archaeon]
MVNEIIKIIEMGKELGISKKEIIHILLFDNSKHAYLWRVLFIIILLLIIIGWYSSLAFLIQKANESVYATGTLYSTVKTKDFQKKYRKI